MFNILFFVCVLFFMLFLFFFFFFFSSRRRHTRLTCDWSSDVCSSDLPFSALKNTSIAFTCCCIITMNSIESEFSPLIQPTGADGEFLSLVSLLEDRKSVV